MLVGEKIGPFEVEGELGSGAMGSVYKVRWVRENGPPVPAALKVVAAGLLGNEGALARFDREAAILKALRHPNIVRLYATGRYKQKTPFLVMEFVDGEALDRVLARRGKLGWEDVVRWGQQLCAALQHAHLNAVIHRDLKPSNLMITRDGERLKLTDFGIAKDTDGTALTAANSTIGTAAYMSPEQCRGERDLTPKSDLYSLGIVFYELLTGRKPFVAETSMDMFLLHVGRTPARPSFFVPDLPVWLDTLVMDLLKKDKDERPADAAAVGAELAGVEDKVRAQQSVGAEVANARRSDKALLRAGPLDDTDREAARTLRAGKKKRKKKPKPGGWRAALPAAGIAVILTGLAGVAYTTVKRPGVATMYAEVQAAPADKKLDAAARFLAAHGAKADDERVAEVRDTFLDLKARELDRQLSNRYQKGYKAADAWDEKAFSAAWLALDAEKAGSLPRAADLWGEVRDRFPPPDPAKLADDAEAQKAAWRRLGERRERLDREGVPAKAADLARQIDQERAGEVAKTYPPDDPEGLAARALKLEQFGDRAKARKGWEELARLNPQDADLRVWHLLAARHAADLAADKGEDDPRAAREKRVADRVAALEAGAAEAVKDPEARAARRDVRNGCREVIALYADEAADPLRAAVERAKKLLDSVPK